MHKLLMIISSGALITLFISPSYAANYGPAEISTFHQKMKEGYAGECTELSHKQDYCNCFAESQVKYMDDVALSKCEYDPDPNAVSNKCVNEVLTNAGNKGDASHECDALAPASQKGASDTTQ